MLYTHVVDKIASLQVIKAIYHKVDFGDGCFCFFRAKMGHVWFKFGPGVDPQEVGCQGLSFGLAHIIPSEGSHPV